MLSAVRVVVMITLDGGWSFDFDDNVTCCSQVNTSVGDWTIGSVGVRNVSRLNGVVVVFCAQLVTLGVGFLDAADVDDAFPVVVVAAAAAADDTFFFLFALDVLAVFAAPGAEVDTGCVSV